MGDITGGWDWMAAFGWILLILFLALIILGVAAEITRDQYGPMRRDLE
jgi:hypothetical protein